MTPMDRMLANPEFPIIITAYTKSSHLGDYYKRMVIRLVNSCIKFDLRYMVFPLHEVTDWVAGCAMKPTIILHALELLKQPILWLDADAEIFKYPKEVENLKTDLALCHVNNHWLSGTLYVTPKMTEFVKEWIKITKPSDPDEITLLQLYGNFRPKPSLTMMSSAYNEVVHSTTDTNKLIIGHHIRPDVAASRGVIPTAY